MLEQEDFEAEEDEFREGDEECDDDWDASDAVGEESSEEGSEASELGSSDSHLGPSPLSWQEQKALLDLTEEEVVVFVSSRKLRAGSWLWHFRDNLHIVRTAVLCSPGAFHYASKELRQNKELAMLAVSRRGRLLHLASAELRDDAEVVTAAVWADPRAFQHASERMRAQRDFVIAAVSQRADLLKYASPELRDDKAVVQTAMTCSPMALRHASDRLRADPDLLLLAAPDMSDFGFRWRNKWLLKFLRPEDCHNMTLLSTLVTRRSLIYGQLPKEAQAHRALAVLAVGQHGLMLEDVPESLRDDFSVVETAIIQEASALQYASARLRGDRQLVMLAVSRCGCTLHFASDELRDDSTVVAAALSQDGSAYEYVSGRLRANHDLAMLAVSKQGCMLRQVPSHLQGDRLLVAAALRNLSEKSTGEATDISYVPTALLRDESFLQGLHLDVFVLLVTMMSGRSCTLAAWAKRRQAPEMRFLQVAAGRDSYSSIVSLCKRALNLPFGSTIQLYSGHHQIPRYADVESWPGVSQDCVAELDLVLTKHPRIAE